MAKFTAYVEDAQWRSRWKIAWKNRYFCESDRMMFYDIALPEFNLSTVKAHSGIPVLQLQLAMGIPPNFDQFGAFWDEASQLHRERADIVFSERNGDRVYVNGDCNPQPKGIEVVLSYRDKPKDISLLENMWNDLEPKLIKARKRVKKYERKLEECENAEFAIENEYDKRVSGIRDECVRKSII